MLPQPAAAGLLPAALPCSPACPDRCLCSPCPAPQLVYPARKVSADKRPRIKGRFVTKAEFELMAAAARLARPARARPGARLS